MEREIITIDEEKCNGCGLCIPNCPEGAIQIIDEKARLISDLFCDGLGACIGHCPEGAISVEKREAELYDEKKVMTNIIPQGDNVIRAHLEHLKEHGEMGYLGEAMEALEGKGVEVAIADLPAHSGCPGAQTMGFESDEQGDVAEGPERPSELTHWPVQFHLIPVMAPHFQGRDVLLCADCVAYTVGDFHRDHLKGRALAIACPKLDEGQGVYLDKLVALIDQAKINTLTVMTMEVPCCNGLLNLAMRAGEIAERKVPIKWMVVGIKGDILKEEWL